MMVKCIIDDFSKIESHWIKENFEASYININERLVKGATYVVYAIEFAKEPFVYIIEDEDFAIYPTQFPIHLFEIVDNRLSKYFCYGCSKINLKEGVEKVPLLSFKEWGETEDFWCELTNYNSEYEGIFKKYKELLDYEYYNPRLLTDDVLLQIIDNEWVMCGDCNESWENKTYDEIIKCPKCAKTYKNPVMGQNSCW